MIRRRSPHLALLLLLALPLACVQKPRAQYSKDQLVKLHETEELMRVLYHDLSPVWDAAKGPSFSAADFKTMARVAERAEAVAGSLASKKVTGWFKEGFAARAGALGVQAKALGSAAGASDQAAAKEAIAGINGTCEACHRDFK